MTTHTNPTASSIRLHHREGRSLANAATQKILKPVASIILRPGKPELAGSLQLIPPKQAEKDCTTRESKIADTWVYTFENPSTNATTTKSTHRLYYFAGGSFRHKPQKEQWLLCAELASKLPEYSVNIVSPPLAPNSSAATALPHLERFYDALAQKARNQNFRITLAGDSSGGNLAIVLGLYAASEHLKEQVSGSCPVEAIMAISPAVDMRCENPVIDQVDPKDPLLSRKTIEEVARVWSGDIPFTDPRVSPILADLSLFRKGGIKVDGVNAGNDVLSPDGIAFREKLARSDVDGDWLEWEKQMHCFPLLFSVGVREGITGKDWLVDTLQENLRVRSL